MTESNGMETLASDRYGDRIGSYHSRKLAFQKAHGELIDHIQRGNADAAYIMVRLLAKLALASKP